MEPYNAFDSTKFMALNNFSNETAAIDDQILNIYWAKKELEEFLPKIGTYANAREVVAITLAQLSMMEKQIIQLLQRIAQNPAS